MTIPQLRNKGLSDASNITLTLSSDNPLITITSGNINVGNIASRTTVNNNQNLSFSISSSMLADVNVKMLVTVLTSGTPMFTDTLSFITGTPILVFADTTNDPLLLWNVTYTPTSSPRWEATTTSYHSSPTSFTDSNNGEYLDNATVTMTLKMQLIYQPTHIQDYLSGQSLIRNRDMITDRLKFQQIMEVRGHHLMVFIQLLVLDYFSQPANHFTMAY